VGFGRARAPATITSSDDTSDDEKIGTAFEIAGADPSPR
jgi:hypothetical protein